MAGDFTPYATGRALFGQKPVHVNDKLDQERLQAYLLYEEMYWNAPDTFKLTQRGTDAHPIYIPSARTIVDTSNRYTAPGFALNIKLPGSQPDNNDVMAARIAMEDFFKRERFNAKFLGAKRYCQIQGDWVWHLTADPDKPVGKRLSLVTLDPSMYFPVHDPDNQERIIGVMLIEIVTEGSDQAVRRLFYRKTVNAGGTVTITTEEGIFQLDQWRNPDAEPLRVTNAQTPLPPEITSIPVYHVKNFEEPGNPFGSSEIRGLEVVMAAINQTVSDEELTLALEGIGQYFTTAPRPINPETKKPEPWKLGPGMVAQIPEGTNFGRVTGAASLTAYGQHYDRLWDAMKWASASPDIAIGTVDVKVAESGIALALQMAPILAKSMEKDELILSTHDQMFFDILTMWYPAYEETTFTDVIAETVVGDKLPVDRAARFTELNDMLDRKVIDTQYYREEAAKLGYVFPADIAARVQAEQKSLVPTDPFADRLNSGLGNGSTGA